MTASFSHRSLLTSAGRTGGLLRLLAGALCVCASGLSAQMSLPGAVALAMQNNPRVRMAEQDVLKSRASLAQTRDVYVPAVSAGAGLGEAYGYTPNPPTLFNLNSNSLVYSSSQSSYIRAARAGLEAAQLTLNDVRDSVAEEVAIAVASLDRDSRRAGVLRQQNALADRLVSIVTDRLAAGQSTAIDLTQAKLTAANLRLSRIHAEDDAAYDREHLGRLIGLTTPVSIDGGFPATALIPDELPKAQGMAPSVASAYANAQAKQLTAHGDARYLYRPQVLLIGQYQRYEQFTEGAKYLGVIPLNEYAAALSIGIPLLDRAHQNRARESAAEAVRAQREAENAQNLVLDARSKLSHSIGELRARVEVAQLEVQLARQQLGVTSTQLTAATSTGTVTTPMDEQNARISEREKYLALLESTYQLRLSEISLLRQTGHLQAWLLKVSTAAPDAPSNQEDLQPDPPAPQP